MTVREQVLLLVVLQTLIPVAAVVFRDSPEDVVLTAGETAVLRCSVQPQGSEKESVQWLHFDSNRMLSKDEAIKASTHEERYSVVGNHESDGEYFLRIHNVQPSDKGEYRCIYGSVYRSAVLTVVTSPDSGRPLCEVHPDPTQQLPRGISELSCTVQGDAPSADLIWYRQGVPISDVAHQTNSMQRSVAAEDNGVKFTCSAKPNAEATGAIPKCEVMVLNVPPTGVISPQTYVVHVGGAATYRCTGDGIPAVSRYSWLVNDVYIENRTNFDNRYELLENNKTLRISNVQKWEDGANITCEVSLDSGLKSRVWAKLSTVSLPVTSTANGVNPDIFFPTVEEFPYENDSKNTKNTGPTVLKPQANNATAGVVAGAVLATIGLILAAVAIAILLVRIKVRRQFNMDTAHKSKCSQDKSVLPTAAVKNVDSCPIYAKPNKLRKGPAPAAPSGGGGTSAASNLASQNTKSRRNHHSYEKVDILGISPGQTCTLPVRLQGQALTVPGSTRRSDTARLVKAQAPLPPRLLRSPLPPPPQMSPPSIPRRPNAGNLVYADLDLETKGASIVQAGPLAGVDYAMLQVHSAAGSGVNDHSLAKDASGQHSRNDGSNVF